MEKKNTEKKCPDNIVRAIVASGVLIREGNKFLLVRENEAKGEFWNLPVSTVEQNLAFAENATKQAKEKTGYDVKIIKKIGIFQKDGEEVVNHIFEAQIAGGNLKLPKGEIVDAKWFTLDEIRKMIDKLKNSWVLEAIEVLEEQKKTRDYLDSWRRCQADFENYKKDQLRAREEFAKFAKRDVIEQILPVLDNFESALEHVPETEKKSAWVTGLAHIKKQVEDILRNNGVEEIVVKIGDKFDPEVHEAVAGKGGDRVRKILQKGYRLNGRILRATRVEVE